MVIENFNLVTIICMCVNLKIFTCNTLLVLFKAPKKLQMRTNQPADLLKGEFINFDQKSWRFVFIKGTKQSISILLELPNSDK